MRWSTQWTLTNGEVVFQRDHSLHGARNLIGPANGHVVVLDNGDWLISWGRGPSLDEVVTPGRSAHRHGEVLAEELRRRQGSPVHGPRHPVAALRAGSAAGAPGGGASGQQSYVRLP